jgi:hypothetical protein
VTLIDPDINRWLCCGQPVHAAGCTANRSTYRYGSEPGVAELGLMPPPTCRDCGVHLGHYHHQRCCLAACRRCDQQQLMCACATTTLELVQ